MAVLAALIPAAAVALLWGLLAWQARVIAAYNRDIVHSSDVIATTWRTNKLLVDRETGVRAFLLTHDARFLEPFVAAAAELPPTVETLARMVAGHPVQSAQVASLRQRYERWAHDADEIVRDVPPSTVEPSFREEMLRRKAEMDDMRQSLRAVYDEEERLLAASRERADRSAMVLLGSGSLVAAVLGVAATLTLRRFFQALDSAYMASYEAQVESARRAEHANRLKDDFLATLSHELRTPLNAIVGWAHILASGQADEATTQKAATTIHRNALAQNQLVSDLLDVSRIITGKLALKVAPVDLDSVVGNAVETVSPAAAAKRIRIDVIVDSGAAPLLGDADRLQQVVWNLLSNAVKFSPRDTRIQTRVARINSHVEIVVADNGPGIAPGLLPHVFERFWQADSSASRMHGGLGLGLAIVRHLVELHGGTVSAANRTDTSGAVFSVKLPLRAVAVAPATSAEAAPAPAPSAAPVADISLIGVRVLVVDDEADARDLLLEVLSRHGASVSLASSAAEALDRLRLERPDVLVADVGMPGEDGYSLLLRVRALPTDEGAKTPALALTAFARAEDRTRALAAGFDLHLAKPADASELAIAVSTLAARSPHTPR